MPVTESQHHSSIQVPFLIAINAIANYVTENGQPETCVIHMCKQRELAKAAPIKAKATVSWRNDIDCFQTFTGAAKS